MSFHTFYFLMTLDLCVYVEMSEGGFLFSQQSVSSWNLYLGFIALCCNSLSGLSSSWVRPSFIIPAYTESDWMISRWPMHAPWTLVKTSDQTVCVNIKSWHSSLCDEQKTCWNAFWKLFCQKWHALPATNCRCDFFWPVFLLLSYINCTH